MILSENKLGLYMNIKINTNSKELFNYKSKNIKEINTIIDNDTYILRKGEKILRANKHSDIESTKGELLLFHIRNKKYGIFSIENPVFFNNVELTDNIINGLNNKTWYVLNSENPNINSNNEDYNLTENDIIKLGNIKLIIKEIHIENSESQNNQNTETNNENISTKKNGGPIFNIIPQPQKYFISENNTKKENIKCSICYKYECDIKNPILSFCECNCYMNHFKCLKNVAYKRSINKCNINKTINYYYIKVLKCRKCKSILPFRFTIPEAEQPFDFIDIIKPNECNYMIIESLENKIFYGHLKLIFIVKLGDNKVKIGRSDDNDIIIKDPSVSKNHAEIIYKNGNIYIKNLSEMFGTLILIKKPITLNDKYIKLQIGNTVIDTKIMKHGDFEEKKNKHTRILDKTD